MSVSQSDKKLAETYFVGKRDFKSFFVTVCRNGLSPERVEGFASAEEARAWVRNRMQSQMTLPAQARRN